jgi:uncharacterized protein YbaA (DUF1428 family)
METEVDPTMLARSMPFDGKRMIYGGFASVVRLEK